MTDSLNGVRVEKNPLFTAYRTDLGYGLDSADLVVRIHYRNECSLVGDSVGNLRRLDNSVLAYGEICDRKSVLFKISAGMKNCVVFKCACDYVIFSLFGKASGCRTNCPVVAFRSAACEEDLARSAAECRSSLFTSLLNNLLRISSKLVYAGRIAVLRFEIRQHRVKHIFGNSRCGGVVGINITFFHGILFLYL